jgi:hypothetical protein
MRRELTAPLGNNATVYLIREPKREPVITELKGKGLSLAKIAGELNKRKVPTPRGADGITSRWGMCCNASQLEVDRQKTQDIGFQAGTIRR